jgi:hypothetical protein
MATIVSPSSVSSSNFPVAISVPVVPSNIRFTNQHYISLPYLIPVHQQWTPGAVVELDAECKTIPENESESNVSSITYIH